MKQLKNILKRNALRVCKYERIGKAVLVNTPKGKYVIKKTNINQDIFNYLITRNFNYYPDIIDFDDNYKLTRYIDDINIPNEQKMNDLINLVALLHSKTTYYKELNEAEYKKLYEDLNNNIQYLKEYYYDLITLIDSKTFMSPPEYLLARNISSIFSSLDYCNDKLNSWYNLVSNLEKMRVSVIHNNLDLKHFIKNNNDYLISWDKTKIDLPIFDLYKLYNRHSLDFDFSDILKKYETIYPLKKEELELLFILISMPKKIIINKNNFEMCKEISKEIDKIYKTNKLIKDYKKIK